VARPIISVIISAKNEAERVEACFDSLGEQRTRFAFEVILVDNGSTDGTYSLAKKLALRHKNFFVFREKRPGSASARNLGAAKARGEVLLFTDADCRFSSTWVAELARPLLAKGGKSPYPLAAVGGRTLSAFGNGSPTFVESYLDQLFDFWESDRLAPFPAFLPWAPTCNLAVKKEIFQGIGGFDPRWQNAAYDVDLCWRLVLCGFMLGYAPKAVVHHLRRRNLRGLGRQMANYSFYNHSLLATYERVLRLNSVAIRRERIIGRSRRALELVKETKSLRSAGYRGLDLLSLAASVKGGVRSRMLGLSPDPRLDATRRGELPPGLEKYLPPGYAHLHREGWSYWKSSPSLQEEDSDLILFRPRQGERFRMNSSAWKIWEVKANRKPKFGQSEHAALALGQSSDDSEVLRDIDQCTLDLRTRRLLP
jgi:glycosyltransferase involved in cell wall biosynthesis